MYYYFFTQMQTDLLKFTQIQFQIPEDESKGWEATKWNLNKPDWTGKLKVVSKGTNLTIKLEDRGSMKPFAIVSIEFVLFCNMHYDIRKF